MKKIISLLLVAVLAFSLCLSSAGAATSFDKSVFENSSKFTTDGFRNWNLQAHYINVYSNAVIKVYLLLFSNYVTEGWGPELRVYFHDSDAREDCQVTAFRANINGTLYCFDKLAAGSEGDGYAFGGSVMESFCRALLKLDTAAFQFEYIDYKGDTITAWDDHIHTGELSDLIDVARYLIDSRAFTIDQDPKGSDEYYGAYIEK